jgi:hypothetical protein
VLQTVTLMQEIAGFAGKLAGDLLGVKVLTRCIL